MGGGLKNVPSCNNESVCVWAGGGGGGGGDG